jgi:hypothetical protein
LLRPGIPARLELPLEFDEARLAGNPAAQLDALHKAKAVVDRYRELKSQLLSCRSKLHAVKKETQNKLRFTVNRRIDPEAQLSLEHDQLPDLESNLSTLIETESSDSFQAGDEMRPPSFLGRELGLALDDPVLRAFQRQATQAGVTGKGPRSILHRYST